MITRRTFAGLIAGALLSPGLAAAQQQPTMRRTLDATTAMPEAGRRPWAEQVPQLRVGLLGGENEADRLGRFGAYRDLLERTFGVPTRLFPASDYAGVLQAFSAGQIEIASMGASGYAGAWLDTNGGVEPLVVAEENDGSIAYVAVLVVRADSGITTMEQMRGKSLAWADPNSTSGYLIPRFALRRAGIGVESGQYFSRTGFAGGHEQGVVAVLQRQYDGAVTWASGQGDVAQGYSRGNLRAMVDKGMLNMADLRVIWTSDPIPNGPLTARSALPAAFKEDIKRFHLALPKAHPDIYQQIERGGGTGYREVTHQTFELIVELRREEAAARRRRS
ncbi:phosphate/phosphite/phosphonate ABC transporter substrate-binding protein [Neoroseomonas oryzicola]|uniref:Phosphate/phosphite/phosphonate ABC transporter substrate-binding protein n=1 Tax=Neoroseomonas oryzicola TaxID=535904 RepID=A0A9X9WMB7_9PROT|nr:phosphate/phosphite/phosphonate ABC transporter substrate-binding protein [Neoroseomonas oryzicola]MBR0661477.1 phosphate/phosphite/phosphonate ABC transporter substrate-binding protein [Neoroseomonas oryzicola]NKE19964.1 phosphate/phosphite/phosphonate ABC transporter substrate-binding protein [Neoroseomonas oryzicola]